MAIRVTYIDGHTADYDDRTHWYVEHGVLKLGSLKGRWDTYISPSSWETIDTNPLWVIHPGLPRRSAKR